MHSIHRNTWPPQLSPFGLGVARANPLPGSLRILVADDDPDCLENTCAQLRRWGLSSQSAVDGVQAVALARMQDFDLILMDLQMPVMDGLAATKQIRALEQTRSHPRTPVLAYTSCALGDELLQHCGVDGVLNKPCSAEALLDCLLRWCGPRTSQPARDACIAAAHSLR